MTRSEIQKLIQSEIAFTLDDLHQSLSCPRGSQSNLDRGAFLEALYARADELRAAARREKVEQFVLTSTGVVRDPCKDEWFKDSQGRIWRAEINFSACPRLIFSCKRRMVDQ